MLGDTLRPCKYCPVMFTHTDDLCLNQLLHGGCKMVTFLILLFLLHLLFGILLEKFFSLLFSFICSLITFPLFPHFVLMDLNFLMFINLSCFLMLILPKFGQWDPLQTNSCQLLTWSISFWALPCFLAQ